MSVTHEYLEYVRELLAWVPELRARRMFGGVGLYSGERFFAILVDDTLYLKADGTNRNLFSVAGGEDFTYLRQGKPRSMSYWSVPAEILEEPDLLRSWTSAALDAALRAKTAFFLCRGLTTEF
jgi:DNA transformation protein